MRILVLGSGGREDAIAWALEWEHHANDDEVFVAPGNGDLGFVWMLIPQIRKQSWICVEVKPSI